MSRRVGDREAVDHVIAKLAKIARIPDQKRKRYWLSTSCTLGVSARSVLAEQAKKQASGTKKEDRKCLKRIIKAATELSRAVRERTDEAGHLLEVVRDDEDADRAAFGPEEFLSSVNTMVEMAKDAVGLLNYKPKRLNDGRPPYTANYPALLLARRLLEDAADSGGKLSADKNNGGSLLAALECVEAVLPPGFKIPSKETLYRISKL